MQKIKLTGKYAVGEHEYALVDDEQYEALSKFKWKAKSNGVNNRVCAVCNFVQDGNNTTLSMHRVVLGLDPQDKKMAVVHINQNGLDNRKENLKLRARGENYTKKITVQGMCQQCRKPFQREVTKINSARVKYCGVDCLVASRAERESDKALTLDFKKAFLSSEIGKKWRR